MCDPELRRLFEELGRGRAGVVGLQRGGANLRSAKSRTASWNICCSSSGVTSKSPWISGLLARRFAELLGALKARPAAVAARKPFFVPL